jgi:hypothetical protein
MKVEHRQRVERCGRTSYGSKIEPSGARAFATAHLDGDALARSRE